MKYLLSLILITLGIFVISVSVSISDYDKSRINAEDIKINISEKDIDSISKSLVYTINPNKFSFKRDLQFNTLEVSKNNEKTALQIDDINVLTSNWSVISNNGNQDDIVPKCRNLDLYFRVFKEDIILQNIKCND